MKDSWFMRPFRIRGGCWRPANVVVPERLCMRDQRLTALAFRDESLARSPPAPVICTDQPCLSHQRHSDTHDDWRLQPSLTTECILMHAPCQPAAL